MADPCTKVEVSSVSRWLPVHRDQLWVQRSVTSMGKLYPNFCIRYGRIWDMCFKPSKSRCISFDGSSPSWARLKLDSIELKRVVRDLVELTSTMEFRNFNNVLSVMVAWHSGRTSVSGRRTFPVLRSTCSWWVITKVGKPSATGQPTRPTQPFILSGSIKWVVSWNQMCAAVYR